MFKVLLPALFTPIIFLSMLFSQPVFSHGVHYEVQLKSKLQVNTDNRISGVGMVWLYDPIVSADMLKDEPDLKKLEKSIHSNLERFNFFTKLTSSGKVLTTSKVQNFKLEKTKDADVTNLQISFTLPFASPPKLATVKKIVFDYSDPTATAILYYANPEDLMLGYGLSDKCKTSMQEKPSFKEGEFPQVVSINCN